LVKTLVCHVFAHFRKIACAESRQRLEAGKGLLPIGSVNIDVGRTGIGQVSAVIHRKVDLCGRSPLLGAARLHLGYENDLILVAVAPLPTISNNSL
jgi:hypothetical protein